MLDATGSIDRAAGTTDTSGKLIFQGAKETTYTSIEEQGKSNAWQSQGGKGEYKETLKLAHIKAGKGLTYNASGGIEIDIPSVPVEAPAPVLPFAKLDDNGKPIPPPPPLTPAEKAAKQKADFDAHITALATLALPGIGVALFFYARVSGFFSTLEDELA